MRRLAPRAVRAGALSSEQATHTNKPTHAVVIDVPELLQAVSAINGEAHTKKTYKYTIALKCYLVNFRN